MADALEMRVVGVNVIRRRELLKRDPPVDWKSVIGAIRSAGWGTAEICFVLNVSRGALWYWERGGSTPGYEDGRAILKLHAAVGKKSAIG